MNRDDSRSLEKTIGAAREVIDGIDALLVELLNRRAVQAQRIGGAKREIGRPVYQPDREKLIFQRIEQANDGPLEDEALRRLFERILDESRRLERTS